MNLCEAQWLAYALPCRRFAAALTDLHARLRADVDRYSFIVSDLHRLLVAGLPAHCETFPTSSPLAGTARSALHPSVHRHGLRLFGVLAAAVARARNPPR